VTKSPLSLISLLIFTTFLGFSENSLASDFRLGATVGYGGAGITQQEEVQGVETTIQRADAPATFSFFLDYMISDSYSISLEHSRGVQFGPFSSGVSFTGLAGRWYFSSPPPTVAKAPYDETILLVKKFTPFFGLSIGLATGDISRAGDEVPSVSASGVYLGYRLGAEYPLSPGIGIRPEIVSQSTFSSSLLNPASLSFFAFQIGLFFYL
jgi:hypothetical protein